MLYNNVKTIKRRYEIGYKKILLAIVVSVGLICMSGCGNPRIACFEVEGSWVTVHNAWGEGDDENINLSSVFSDWYRLEFTENGKDHYIELTNIKKEGDLTYGDVLSFDARIDGEDYSYPEDSCIAE
jgi:hypothetical protein